MQLDFFNIISNSSFAAQIVLALLLLMSICSWGLIFYKFFNLGAGLSKAKRGTHIFDTANNLREAVQALGHDPSSPLYSIAQKGVIEFNKSRELGNDTGIIVDNVSRALKQGVASELSRLQSSLALLATTANTAPFIGLFGTVWGIMTSFHAIGLLKSASLATVAPGISEALIATALGLFVAIPASMAFNLFNNKIAQLDTWLVNFADSFLNRVQRELYAQKHIGTN